LEEAFVHRGIPYRLVGGTRFYERREVKDLLAYLRLVHNPFDSVALMRVINVPPRGIGDRTLAELTRWSGEHSIPVYAALQLIASAEGESASGGDTERDSPDDSARPEPVEGRAPVVDHPFQKRSAAALLRFLGLLNELIAAARGHQTPLAGQAAPPGASLSALLDTIIERTGYREYLLGEDRDNVAVGEERWENVQELRSVAAQYDELKPEHALPSLLEDAALITDVDEYDEDADAVTLITLHAAKGLEFGVVLIAGLEEGLLPHMRSLESGDPAQLEEERRLCYVGMTRAKAHLYLVRAFRRSFGGHSPPSRFLADIPPDLTTQRRRVASPTLWPTRHRFAAAERVGAPLAAPELAAPEPVGAHGDAPAEGGERGATAETYSAGDHVRHPKFGDGIVVSCQPSGSDYQVVVAFQGQAGIKKLLLSLAPLERVES
jgi:DNA helicase-2/ATP-dependent DNA helicase PcrA